MKFSCEQCQTKYNLPDERVRGKVLKIRCKKCGCQITVSQGGVRTAKGEVESEDATMVGSRASIAALSAGRGGPGGGGGGGGLSDDDGGDSTMIGGVSDFFDKIGAAAPQPQQPDEWHLSLDGTVVDPMPLAELAQRIMSEQATPGRDIFVWREGQAEWLPPESLPEVLAAVEKARKNPAPIKPAAKAAAKPAPAASLSDDEDEGGDKTQMGGLDFAALGLGDTKAAWEEAAKPEPAKSTAKDAAKSEPLKAAAKDAAKSEPLKSAAKEPAKAGAKDSAKAEPAKASAKAEPLKPAAKEALKPALKETPAAKAAPKPADDELLEEEPLESVDAIEEDIAMPAPPPKGSRPAPPKPPALKPPPSLPKSQAAPPASVAPVPIAPPAPVAVEPFPAPAAAAPIAVEPPAPVPEPTPLAPQNPLPSLSPQGLPPGEWPQEPGLQSSHPQAPEGGFAGGYGGYGNLDPGAAAQSHGGGFDAQGYGSPDAGNAAPPAKSKTPIFIGIAVVVALLGGAGYFLLVKPPEGSHAAIVDAGQDAGAPQKPKEEDKKPKPVPPKITGITQAEFDELWSAGSAPITTCFEKLLKKQADLDGKELIVSVEVSEKAKAGEISFAGPELDDKAKKCIQKAMKKWKFPAKDKSAYTAKFPLKISK